ncbi:MAG: hypothetical protein JNK08_07885 [Sediminibacterium sp.]|nr:hypothetical protein [Sediminibacterium sp.]
MKKRIIGGILLIVAFGFSASAQRPSTSAKTKTAAAQKENAEETNPENIFPSSGFAGIGILSPTAPLEIKKSAGNTRNKNFLLKLSNEWASSGQNEPSIMFSNGETSNPKNISFWSIGARVSGDNSLKTPQTFKISHKAGGDAVEKELFSIDSYEGRVKIGDVNTQIDGYKLYVEQGILTEKVKVAVKNSKDWYDHVFHKDYTLMPLHQLDTYIKKNQHLPGIPTAQEVVKDGQDLGKMNALLLQKIEELTLYTIELKKELDAVKKSIQKSGQE